MSGYHDHNGRFVRTREPRVTIEKSEYEQLKSENAALLAVVEVARKFSREIVCGNSRLNKKEEGLFRELCKELGNTREEKGE